MPYEIKFARHHGRGDLYAIELLNIMSMKSSTERMAALKTMYGAVSQLAAKHGKFWDSKVDAALTKNSHFRQIPYKKRTVIDLKDFLSWEVLAAVIAAPVVKHSICMRQICEAIQDPVENGVRGGRAKHGFKFGMPRTMINSKAFIKTLKHHLRATLENAQWPVKYENFYGFNQPTEDKGQPMEKTIDISSAAQAVYAIAAKAYAAHCDGEESWGVSDSKDQQPFIVDALTTIAPELNPEQLIAVTAAIELGQETGNVPNLNDNIVVPDEARDIVSRHAITAPIEPRSGEAGAVTPSRGDAIVVNPSVTPMINAVFGKATNGAFADVETMVARLNAQSRDLAAAHEEMKSFKVRASMSITAHAGPAPVIDNIRTEVNMASAADIFTSHKGKKAPMLRFNVPVLSHFDEQDREVRHHLVPNLDDKYIFRPDMLLRYLPALLSNRNTYVYGHTGTGKSTFIEQVAARLNYPLVRVNLDSNIERADLTGETTVVEENGVSITEFAEGIIPQAMQRPCILLLDEIDFGRSDVLYVIQRALEGDGLLLTEDKGRLVRPHPMFRFAATANTRGQGDEYGCYPGARPLSLATCDRFTNWINAPYLTDEEETALLQLNVPTLKDKEARMMVSFANEVRSAFIGGELSSIVTPRGLLAMAEGYTFLQDVLPRQKDAMLVALESAVIDRFAEDNRQRVVEIAEPVFGVA